MTYFFIIIIKNKKTNNNNNKHHNNNNNNNTIITLCDGFGIFREMAFYFSFVSSAIINYKHFKPKYKVQSLLLKDKIINNFEDIVAFSFIQ